MAWLPPLLEVVLDFDPLRARKSHKLSNSFCDALDNQALTGSKEGFVCCCDDGSSGRVAFSFFFGIDSADNDLSRLGLSVIDLPLVPGFGKVHDIKKVKSL